MKMGSFFSGSGGFELAGEHVGIHTVWESEIEPFPMMVTQVRFPDAKQLGDISRINGALLEPVDIVAGGSPCQNMSIAGNRTGLDGEQSVLFREYVRIVKEMRLEHGKPRFMVFENVPGAFSSNKGEDFRCVLEEIAGIAQVGVSVPRPPGGRWKPAGGIMGDRYSVAWRVLDAQYWGIPQRRKRIYLVADFGGWTAGEILFKRKGLCGDTAQGAEAGEEPSGEAENSLGASGGGAVRPKTLRIRCGCAGGGKGPLVQEDKSATLSCHNDQTVFVPAERRVVALENHSQDSRVDVAKDNIRTTLTGKMGTGGNNVPLLMESRSTAYGICSMDSNAMKSENPDSGFYEAQTSRTIDCRGGNPACNQGGIVIVGEKHPVYSVGRDCVTVHEDRAQTLTAELLPGSVAQPYSVGNGQTHSLSLDEKAGTLNCIHDQQAVMVPKAVDASHADDVVRISDTASVQARDYKGGKYVFAEYIVRRFTPLECGRLQGFPDDWTDGLSDEAPDKKTVQFWLDAWMEWWALVGRAKGIKRPKDEKAVRRWLKDPASDTEIYKMWGNGIALPCAQYVFEGIAAVLGVTESDTQKGDDGIG